MGKVGRPPVVNAQVKQRIINALVKGDTLTRAAQKVGVVRGTLYKWMKSDDEFASAVKEAREFAAIDLIDQIIHIADDDTKDILQDNEGNQRPNTAAVQRSKLKIEARTRLGKYYNRQMFGDQQKVDVTSNGKDVYQGLMITPPKLDEDDDVDKE